MRLLTHVIACICTFVCAASAASPPKYPFQDWHLSPEARASDLVGRLTLDEKAHQLVSMSPAVERLDWNPYNWRSECCHGWGFTGTDWEGSGWDGHATIFPHVIGLGATFDPELIRDVGFAAGLEGRAAFNNASRQGILGHMMSGLHCFGPTENVVRDPRWGRIKRTWGESPFLTGQMSSAHLEGLRGDQPVLRSPAGAAMLARLPAAARSRLLEGVGETHYVLMSSGVNMYGVHSGPDSIRTAFEASTTSADAEQLFLEAFHASVQQGGVESVMVAYSGIALDGGKGIPDNANAWLINDTLKNRWGFDGVAFSDNGGVPLLYTGQHYADSKQDAVRLAANAFLDQDMTSGGPPKQKGGPWNYGSSLFQEYIPGLVQAGNLTMARVDDALKRVLRVRFKTGADDPSDVVPWSFVGPDVIGSREHAALTLRAAIESTVLLQNRATATSGHSGAGEGSPALPLSPSQRKNVLVVGPNANRSTVLYGGTYAAFTATQESTPLQGLQAAWGESSVQFVETCPDARCQNTSGFDAAVQAASGASAIVVVGGLDGTTIEREGADRGSPSTNWTDGYPCEGDYRDVIGLPGCQQDLFIRLQAAAPQGTPVVLVVLNGGAVSVTNVTNSADAILDMFYPGPAAGAALASMLSGESSPAGRMPYTVFESSYSLPAFEDYGVGGRTLRFLAQDGTQRVLFGFGYGLDYAGQWKYEASVVPSSGGSGGEQQKEEEDEEEHPATVRSGVTSSVGACSRIRVQASATNGAAIGADAVLQLYLKSPSFGEEDGDEDGPAAPSGVTSVRAPRLSLAGFARRSVPAGGQESVSFEVTPFQMAGVDPEGNRWIVPGTHTLYLGGSQPDLGDGLAGSAEDRSGTGEAEVLSVTVTTPDGKPVALDTCQDQELAAGPGGVVQ